MKIRINKWGYLLLNIILTIILFLTFSSVYNLVNFINSLFYISFAYLIVLLFLTTIRGGFYDGVTFGFRRFYSVMSKKDYLDEWKEKPLPSEKFNEKFYQSIKFQTIMMVLIFVLFLGIYYLVN